MGTDDLRDWAEAKLRRIDRAPTGDAETVRRTARSIVLRIPTSRGDAFAKEDRIGVPSEAVVVARLVGRARERLAPVLAVEPERGRLLTDDVGDGTLDRQPIDDWCTAMRELGRVQCTTMDDSAEWLALGVPDWRANALVGRLDALLADEALLRPGAEGGLRADHLAHLRARRDAYVAHIHALARGPVPDALVHQDVVAENVMWGERGPCFIDWADSVVGHPFFACDRLLDAIWNDRPARERVVAAYLESFGGFADAKTSRALFDHVLGLRVFYEDIRWHQELAALDRGDPHAERLRADIVVGLTAVAQHELAAEAPAPEKGAGGRS